MRIVIDTENEYDILLFALTAVDSAKTDSTHGMYKLSEGTHFVVDEYHQPHQLQEAEP